MTKVVLFILLVKDSCACHSSMGLGALYPALMQEGLSLGSPRSLQPSALTASGKEASRCAGKGNSRHPHSEAEQELYVPAGPTCWVRSHVICLRIQQWPWGRGWGQSATCSAELTGGKMQIHICKDARSHWHSCSFACVFFLREDG